MILVLATQQDEHARAVIAEITALGGNAALLDLADFPQRLHMSLRYAESSRRFAFFSPDGDRSEPAFDLAEFRSIWWRRPQQPVISDDIRDPTHQLFATNEAHEALAGLWYAVDAFWINEPARDQLAHRKVYQLRVAQDVGLRIPQTLITSDPEAAGEFIAERRGDPVVFKAFSALPDEWRETRLLGREELDLLSNVRYAPVIFQEYIDATYDLRVTVVGDRIFPAAIHSQETSYKVDFRMDMANARVEPVELPKGVEKKLHALMGSLGLVYGAIDMRRTPSGEHVFLEINPAGQWLFVEQHTHQPIAAELARLLVENDK
jgi:hypothetical protein